MELIEINIYVPKHVRVTYDKGEVVLLNLHNGNFYGLDEVGSHFWHFIESGRPFSEWVADMKQQFDVEEERLRTDWDAFLLNLQTAGLVTVNE